MKAKNQKSKKNQKNEESEKQKKNKQDKKIKESNLEQEKEKNKTNNNDNKINEVSKDEKKKISPWIFLYGKDLQGFHTAFIMMILLPISVFFIIRNILSKFNFTQNQQNVYGVVGVLISVWLILVTYIIYYYRNDFYVVFCKKKEKEKDKNE